MRNAQHHILFMVLTCALASGALACGGATDSGGGEIGEVTPVNPDVKAQIGSVSLTSGYGNLQIAFVATEAKAPAAITVKEVVLLEAESGMRVGTLDVSSPSIWNGAGYEAWNQTVTPGGDLVASYTLSAQGERLRDSNDDEYSKRYRLRITLRIDAAEVTLESEEFQRDPPVVT